MTNGDLKCLIALRDMTLPDGEMCAHFEMISVETKLPHTEIRRRVRRLARKGLAESSRDLSAIGFGGRAVIHPTHCPPVNAAFSPTDDDIAWARSVLDLTVSGLFRTAAR